MVHRRHRDARFHQRRICLHERTLARHFEGDVIEPGRPGWWRRRVTRNTLQRDLVVHCARRHEDEALVHTLDQM